jgi:hypothetical protein
MYTTPPATAGELSVHPFVVYFHRSAPVPASKAYTLLSRDPIYTTPLTIVGEDWKISAPVVYVHTTSPVLAFNARRVPSSDPTYKRPLAMAGESVYPPVVYLHSSAPVLAFNAYR